MKSPFQNTEPLGNSWKRYNEDEFGKMSDKYSYVRVWKTGLPLNEMKRRGLTGTHIFSGRIGRFGQTTKRHFKTRKQSMTFAKQWMKLH